MIFEFGKRYIVDVTEKGITPLMIFDEDRWYDKDHDDLDFLTDEEKIIVINDVLDKIRAEIEELQLVGYATADRKIELADRAVLRVIDKYKAEMEKA